MMKYTTQLRNLWFFLSGMLFAGLSGSLSAQDLPRMDRTVPSRLSTATFALG